MGDVVLKPMTGKGRKQMSAYCIEGEYVTIVQIATRLGCSVQAANGRMGKLRNTVGTITWDKLRRAGR